MRARIRVVLLASALGAAATPVHAQVDISKPIAVKVSKPKILRFQGQVMNATPTAITVHSRENERVIRIFTYSPKVREQIQKLLDRGGYQYGDKVEIQYEAGSDVALQIKGKPSRPR